MAPKDNATGAGREAPRGKAGLPPEEKEAALDHVQVSGVGDVVEGGGIIDEDGKPVKKSGPG